MSVEKKSTALVRCKSCRGEYMSVDKSGNVYYHQCPSGVVNPRNENKKSDGKIISEGAGIVAV